jgi:hypothetical protein
VRAFLARSAGGPNSLAASHCEDERMLDIVEFEAGHGKGGEVGGEVQPLRQLVFLYWFLEENIPVPLLRWVWYWS